MSGSSSSTVSTLYVLTALLLTSPVGDWIAGDSSLIYTFASVVVSPNAAWECIPSCFGTCVTEILPPADRSEEDG